MNLLLARHRLILGIAIAAAVLLLRPSAAHALNCTFSVEDVAFGNVDTLAGTAVDVTADIDISCVDILLVGVRICPYLGNGTGGRDASARYMQGPSTTLAYQLYTDAARTNVWGDPNLGFGTWPTVDFTGSLFGRSDSTTLTIYARVLGGQSPVPAGAYTSLFTAAHTRFNWGVNLLGSGSCGALQLLLNTSNPTFDVTANVEKNCLLTADDIDFGTHGVLSADVTSEGAVTLECTPETDYSVALDNGNTGTGPTARKMVMGAEDITYGLYKDSGHTQPWGDSGTPGSALEGSGTGAEEVIPVYGQVPSQPTPPPGDYTDSVIATVTY